MRAEALNALAQIDPPEARPTLKKVLARRDECSVQLRRRAVYILGPQRAPRNRRPTSSWSPRPIPTPACAATRSS